jgi:hypothetical protein
MINPMTHVFIEFPVPTPNTFPESITTGPDGNLWFAEYGANQIGMINPTTDAIAEFAVPTTNRVTGDSAIGDITSGPDGNLWFTNSTSNEIGEFPLSAATPAPPGVAGSVGVSQSRKGTSYNIAFDQPLSADASINVGLYRVFEGVTKVVKRHKDTVYTKVLKLKGVAYNPATNTVTIMLSKRYKGPAEVSIASGLEGTFGATSSTITLVVP